MKSQDKKILLILPFFYPHKGGSQKYAEELHAKMVELDKEIHVDILCYNSKNSREFEHYRGMNIYRVPCYTVIEDKFLIPKPIALHKKLKELEANNYDYVETHVRFFDPTWWAWKYARKIGAKSIYFGHVPGHPVHNKKIVEVLAKIVDLTIAKWALNKYDELFYANNASKNFYEKIFKLKRTGKILHISINPQDFESYENKKERILPRTKELVGEKRTLISYLGRMIETKGIMQFYEAIKNLRVKLAKDDWEKLEFCFGGPGKLNEILLKKVKEDKLEDSVNILGELEYKEVKTLLGISNVFINPSSHDEGLPNTILEAGASNCYVIATDTGAISDIINEKTGKLIRKGNVEDIINSIEWVLKNRQEANEISTNLQKEIRTNYTWEHTAKEFLKYI